MRWGGLGSNRRRRNYEFLRSGFIKSKHSSISSAIASANGRRTDSPLIRYELLGGTGHLHIFYPLYGKIVG
jgi:hypothetical protein